MLNSSIRLFRVKGIPVGVNWTWLFIFLLIFWTLAGALFPSTYPGLSGGTYAAMGAVATLLFFGSILFHELSHTLRALREGVRVREITLWLFGGVSKAEGQLPSAGAEFRVVAAGPLSSAFLALVFLGLTLLARAAGAPVAVRGVTDYLARINGILAAFNLVPALPLDGGRILHSALWRRSGDRAAATLSAAAAGRAFGFLLIGLGLLSALTGAGIGGFWFVFLGWYLLRAAQEEALGARLERALSGLRVRDVLARQPATVAVARTIDRVAAPVGARSPSGHGEVLLAGDRVPVVHPDEPVLDALETLQQGPGRAVVLDGGTGGDVVGVLSVADLERALQGLPLGDEPPGPRRAGNLGIWLVVGLVFAVALAALYHPPYVVVSPGDAFDIRGDITISGVPAQQPTGPYMLTSVRLSQPSALGVLMAMARSDRQVLSAGDVTPNGISPGAIANFERQLYIDSEQMAAAAAATAAGYHATLTGSGARVLGLASSSPAAAVLKVGDTITAVDGQPVTTDNDLRNALRGRPAGQTLTLTVERNGRTLQLRTRTARLPQVSGGSGIGVVVATRDLHVVLPFNINIRARPGIGGPSAGLAYALAVTDMLDPTDDAHGRAIAATGTIAPDGSVGAVGGVHEKAVAVRRAGAKVFLVPADELSSVKEGGLLVRGVTNLGEAVRVLQTT